MRNQIRMVQRTKYEMLPEGYKGKLSVSYTLPALSYLSTMPWYSDNFLLESIFLLCCYKLFLWLLVENRWPAILCKIRNTKIIAFEYRITLTRSSMVLTYSQDNWLCYLKVLQNSKSQNYKQKRSCDQTDLFIYFHFFPKIMQSTWL